MAADAATDFAFLVAAARRSIADLRREVDRVPVPTGRRGSYFLALVSATLDALEQAIGARETAFGVAVDEVDKRAVVRAMRQINHYALSFHGVTAQIESARGPTLGLGLLYFVDGLARALLKEQADVVITPSGKYNYATGHRPFEAELRTLGVTTYPVTVSPILVVYPVQELDSLFLHLIIAHELGHSVVHKYDLDQGVKNADPDNSATVTTLTEATVAYSTIENRSIPFSRAKVGAMFNQWLVELLCDGLALAVLGPSYLLTHAAFSTPVGGPEPSPSHPPFTLRGRLLLRELESWGWKELVEQRAPAIHAWVAAAASEGIEAGHRAYFAKIEEAVERLFPAIEATVEAHVGGDRYKRATYELQGPELEELLERNVLPVQLGDRSPADARAIILAGWLHAVATRGDNPVALVTAIGDREYQRFLGKALELSAVVTEWQPL